MHLSIETKELRSGEISGEVCVGTKVYISSRLSLDLEDVVRLHAFRPHEPAFRAFFTESSRIPFPAAAHLVPDSSRVRVVLALSVEAADSVRAVLGIYHTLNVSVTVFHSEMAGSTLLAVNPLVRSRALALALVTLREAIGVAALARKLHGFNSVALLLQARAVLSLEGQRL